MQQPTLVANLIKLRLVEFSKAAPEVWLSTAEAIFHANGIMDELTRYSYLLHSLQKPQLERIKSIIEAGDTIAVPYTEAKMKLLDVYGETEEKKIQKLLNSTQFNVTKLSLILEKIVNSAGKAFHDNAMSKIPLKTPSIGLPISELAKKADNVWRLQQQSNDSKSIFLTNNSSLAVPEPVQAQSTYNTEALLLSAPTKLTREVAALRRSRSQSRDSSQRHKFGSSSSYQGRSTICNGKCWYHNKFGDRAQKCNPNCSEYRKDAEN